MTFVTTSTSPFLATDGVAGIVHVPTELTVAQAAKFLGIPESDLIELLDIGEIESRQIGNRRIVVAHSLFDYDRETTRLQEESLDELTKQAQELGLY